MMPTIPPIERTEAASGHFAPASVDLIDKLMRFGVVGVLNTLIDYAVFVFCFQVVGLAPLIANTAAFLTAVNFAYVMNKSWTFRDRSRGRTALRRGILFLASYFVGFVAGSTVLWLMAPFVDPRIAKIASIGVSLVVNFSLSKTFVFRPPSDAGDNRH